MATNWITLTLDNLSWVLQKGTITRSNENTAADSGDNLDTSLENRANQLLTMAIAEVRGAIQSAGRYPLSVTANTVPPEYQRHTLNLAAYQLINSTPSLQMAILTDNGISSLWTQFYKDAMAAIQKLREGNSFTQPTDPTGEDYLTAVDATTNPALEPIRSGSYYDNTEQDLTTENFNPDTV